MPGHDMIVVGASAGGVEALGQLVENLPRDLPAAICVVLHIPAYGYSVLPSILSRRGPLPAVHPRDGDLIQLGHIYVAPPDHHLLFQDGYIRLTRGPAENGHRPAIDPLFRSAARGYGKRAVGVILTGTLDDGTAGLQAIKMRGGKAIVQDPQDALFSGMPRSAIDNVAVDRILPLSEIPAALTELAFEPAEEGDVAMPDEKSDELRTEVGVAEMDMKAIEQERAGAPSAFSCPDCHGTLWELQEGELVRFRCRVGHAFSPDSLMASQSESLEEALWAALRALEESAALARRLTERARERGHALAAQNFEQQTQDALHRAAIVRQALLRGQIIATPNPNVPVPAQQPF